MYESIVTLHAFAGTLALLAFWAAAFSRKGSIIHVRSGKLYLSAMVAVLASGFPIAIARFLQGQPVTGAFLSYLLIISTTTAWLSWRAVRDQGNWRRFTGPIYRVLMWLNLAGGLSMFAVGYFFASNSRPVVMGYSLIGLLVFNGMRKFAKVPPAGSRWWLGQHINGMMGNAVATHVAFLSIGLPKLIPQLAGPTLQMMSWFGPIVAALLAGSYFSRKFVRQRSMP